jgi:Skp family chaperone for outer membrane proteins
MRSYPSLILSTLLVIAGGISAAAQRPAAPAGQRPATPAPQTPTPSAPATATLPMSKMAVIYSDSFLDPKTGIGKFSIAITKLNGEFQKEKDNLTQMQTRAQQLTDELGKLQNAPAGTPIDQRTVQTKADQLEQLKKDIQRKGEDAQAAYNRRRTEIFAPLQQEVGNALEAFAKARNINVIIDGTQVPLLYAADSIDITAAFIADFNAKNPATAAATTPK